MVVRGKTDNTLYVTDLDGTLLRPDETVSQYSLDVINTLTKRGMLFTYATARSAETSTAVTRGLRVTAPRVVYNGAVLYGTDGKISDVKTLGEHGMRIITELVAAGIFPIVYSVIDGVEKFSFIPEKLTDGGRAFIKTREHCVRHNPITDARDLLRGDVFYITCISDEKKLLPFYERYKNEFYCVYDKHYYTGAQWLEIMSEDANKANALAGLKAKYGCRLVVFGDGKNDIGMFRVADECYAVKNASDELKAIATDIIDSNENDGVAKWLEKQLM